MFSVEPQPMYNQKVVNIRTKFTMNMNSMKGNE